MELIPGLPRELGLECLTRLSPTTHRASSQVCHEWRRLLQSRDFYHQRKKHGLTHKLACLVVQSLVVETDQKDEGSGRKPPRPPPSYGITLFDPVSRSWDRLDPIPSYPNGLPLYCQVASCEGKLIVMGGWNPVSYAPVLDVFIYDFTTSRWGRGKDMPCKRSFFAIGAIDDDVYIAGGHDENKNALRSAWTYNVRRDEWTELTQMSRERDECEGVVIGKAFWVVSGYPTNSQGEFDASAESYRIGTDKWDRVDGVWKAKECPRSRVGVSSGGKIVSWSELNDSTARAEVNSVKLDERTLLTSSGHKGEGAPLKLVTIGAKDGRICESEIAGVPREFSGFVQSGCYVEI